MTAAIQSNSTPNLTTPSAVETSCLYSLASKIQQAASALIDLVKRILSAVWHFFKGSSAQPIPQPLPASPTLLTPTPALDSPSAAQTTAVLSANSPHSIDPTTLNELISFDSKALLARPIQAALLEQPQNFRVSETDLWLAASNVVQLGSYYLLKSAVESGMENSGYLNPAVIGASLAVGGAVIHSLANYWMLPRDASLIRRAALIPFANKIPVIGNTLGIFQRVSSLYTISQNTLPKLASSAKTFSARPLHALTHGAVHAFNLGCEAVSLGTSLGLFGQTQPSSSKPKTEPRTPPKTERTRPSNLETLTRLTNPSLNPQKLEDAQKMLHLSKPTVTSSECSNPFLRDTCQKICQSVKKSFNQLVLKVHPDKNPNPLAQLAAANLNAARETLSSAYYC